MSAEYVKLTPGEMVLGETNLLQSQLNLLTMLKQYQGYMVLRKEELFLKIELKKKLGELKEFLDKLDKSLPKSKFLEEKKRKEKLQREIANKIEKAVLTSKKKEEKYWKESDEKNQLQSEETENTKELESQSSLDQELEEIRKKLERLQ